MQFSDKTFAVLDALDREEISNQRQLANHAGVSLGQVNYILNSLVEKGFVKIRNFRKNPHKEGYVYLLTPSGIRKKSALAVKFVLSRLEEYERVRRQLARRLEELDQKGPKQVIFVGPRAVKELMEQLIEEKGLRVYIKEYFGDRAGLQNHAVEPGDLVLLFDGSSKGPNGICRDRGIPRDQIVSLW
jgi:EPS-associated MarR family transcriptional regulator